MAKQRSSGSFQKVYWQDVRKAVAKVNPQLAKLIDKLSPGKDLPLYRASYVYGSVIVEKGKFYLPASDGTLVAMSSSKIPAEISQDFKSVGDELPAGMVLKNSTEIFIQARDLILPCRIHKAGIIFALWSFLESQKVFHPPKLFNITAGARCICMVPNIGDVALHKNLKRDFWGWGISSQRSARTVGSF